jgi:uncharacterized membrane protein YkvI
MTTNNSAVLRVIIMTALVLFLSSISYQFAIPWWIGAAIIVVMTVILNRKKSSSTPTDN